MREKTLTPAEVLAVMDRIASFHHPIDRIEVLKASAAVAALVAERDGLQVGHDALLTVRETLKRECEALKAERDALLARIAELEAERDAYAASDRIKTENLALERNALLWACNVYMVADEWPNSARMAMAESAAERVRATVRKLGPPAPPAGEGVGNG